MRIVKPITLGLLPRAFSFRGRHRLIVGVLGFFRLGGQPRRLIAEHLGWPLLVQALPLGEPVDALFPKPRGEVLVAAAAHAPKGEPVREMSVRVQVSEVDKTLCVIGDRRWRAGPLGGQRTDRPAPFADMPLDWTHAYGGPAHPCNAAGRGYTGRRFRGPDRGLMPNIEYPGRAVRHRARPYPAAGFGPIPFACDERQSLFGKHGARWLETEAPALAGDTDPEAFMSAPADQRLSGFFQGGEPYRLEGLHPEHPVIEGRLPAFRVRVLTQSGDAPLQEADPTRLDTVWLVPGADLGVAVYRTEIPCTDREAADIESVMAAYEDAASAARPLAHYREQFRLRTDPLRAPLYALHDAPLAPAPSSGDLARRAQREAEATAADRAEQQALLDEMDADFWAQAGTAPPPGHRPPQADPEPAAMPPMEAIAAGDADLSAYVAHLESRLESARKEGKEHLDTLKQRLESELAGLGASPARDVPKALAEAEAAARPRAGPLQGAIAAARAAGGLNAEQARQLNELEAALAESGDHMPQALALEPTRDHPGPEVAAHLRSLVVNWVAARAVLAGRDLCGADLVGLDLRGRDLRNCGLERVDLTGADLRGADMRGAVLLGATLDGAELDGADLRQANLCRSRARGARLRGADLGHTLLTDADLTGADLSDAHGDETHLIRTTLERAILDRTRWQRPLMLQIHAGRSRWRGAAITGCQGYQAGLEQADFGGAVLDKAVFVESEARESRWPGAHMNRCLFVRADLHGATLDEVGAELCNWHQADLSGCRGKKAALLRCDLGEARLDRADLRDALLAHSLLIKASLREADLRGANLFQALAGKCDFRRADLRGANLVRLYSQDARFEDARLDGAERTRLGEAA